MPPGELQPTLDSATLLIDRLEADIVARRARIGVIGLGYVGLPLAKLIGERGFKVVGFDTDPHKIQLLANGRSYIAHIPATEIETLHQSGHFLATMDFDLLAECAVIVIAVPTPLTRHREPDLSYVVRTVETIARYLRPGHLVVLESTTYPGTCTDVVLPILQATGVKVGKDFFLAYSPEREDPGNVRFSARSIPKIVGSDDPASQRLALAFYGEVVVETIPVSTTRTAEAVKLTENIFRAVNVALVNELKVVYTEMGIDIWEVIKAASSKPFGFMPFYPGPGLGGHCIPVDPFYLTWKAREYGIATRFIELAGEINSDMPHYVLGRVAKALDEAHRRGFTGSRILIVGLSYKKNVADIRESPSLRLIEMLEARGVEVAFYDTHVREIPLVREYPRLHGRAGIVPTPETIARFHVVLIATDHDDIDYPLLAEHAAIIVDARNALESRHLQARHILKA